MILKKGTYINFKASKNSEQICVIEKGGATATLIFFSAEKKELRQFSRVNLNSPQTLKKITVVTNPQAIAHPDLIAFEQELNVKCKKGSYMSIINNEDIRQYGIITKGGSKATLSIANSNMEITSNAANFKDEGAAPVIEVPFELKDWSFTAYKRYDKLSEETVAFTANVKYKGKKVLDVGNKGFGGCMDVHGDYEFSNLLTKHVTESIIRLFPDENNRPTLSEMDESFINWYHSGRTRLVEWKNELENYIFDHNVS